MVSEIVLRSAGEQDVPALVRLLRRSWLVTWAPELPFEAVQAFAAVDPVRYQAENEWPNFTVATSANVLLGMVQMNNDFVEALHVDPGHWNLGVGSKLLNEAEEQIARTFPVARLEVRSFNSRARAFYARRGWTEVRKYAGTECGCPVDNFEMQKILLDAHG